MVVGRVSRRGEVLRPPVRFPLRWCIVPWDCTAHAFLVVIKIFLPTLQRRVHGRHRHDPNTYGRPDNIGLDLEIEHVLRVVDGGVTSATPLNASSAWKKELPINRRPQIGRQISFTKKHAPRTIAVEVDERAETNPLNPEWILDCNRLADDERNTSPRRETRPTTVVRTSPSVKSNSPLASI